MGPRAADKFDKNALKIFFFYFVANIKTFLPNKPDAETFLFINVYQVGVNVIIFSYNSTKNTKNIPKCDFSFDYGELHQSRGHMMLTVMST